MFLWVDNKYKTFQYFLVWILYAILHAVSMQWIIDLPFWILLTDSILHAALFAIIGIFLWNVMKYGNYERIPFLQRIINYSALAVLSIGLWIGICYGLDYIIFGEEKARLFIPVLPLLILLGIMIYLIIIFYFRGKVSQLKISEEIAENTLEEELSIASELNVEEETDEAPVELLERIAVKSGHKIHVILVPDITFLQADGDYVQIHTPGGKYLKEQTMKYFEENLPVTQFVRVHRSFIVNIEAIARIEQYEKQNQLLTLKNGDKIKVSIAGYKLLKSRLGL